MIAAVNDAAAEVDRILVHPRAALYPEGGAVQPRLGQELPALPPAAPLPPRPARSLADRRHAAAVEEMASDLAEAEPDPVDVFEDALADELGRRRHPGLPLEDWRRLRVQYVEERT